MDNERKVSLFRPVSLWAFFGALFILLFSVFLLLWHRGSLPPKVPLWFSQPWGETRLSDPVFLWLLPLLIALFFVVNNVWAKFLEKNHPQLSLLLVWTSFLIAIVCFFPLYRIILAVI